MNHKESEKWDSGWYSEAFIIESPNFDERPKDTCVNTLVLHSISLPPGEYGGDFVECFFQNRLDCTLHPYFEEIRDLCVSAHFYIKRDGYLVQFVSTDKRAWHAGQSRFDGKEAVNDFSIGIELEGLDSEEYTQAQYRQLANLTKEIQRQYPQVSATRIVAHSEIAPERKTDPGPWFDWDQYWDLIS